MKFTVDNQILDSFIQMLKNFGTNFKMPETRELVIEFDFNSNGLTEDWLNTLVEFLPLIEQEKENATSERSFEKERNPNRTFMHTLTVYEVILLIKLVYSQEKLEAIASSLHMESDAFENFFTEHELPTDFELFIEKDLIDYVVRYLERRDDMQYGDLIGFTFLDYRNQGIFVYIGSGSGAIPLSCEPDEYGTIPRVFPAITEFPPQYFMDGITHNYHVWVPRGLRFQVDSLDQLKKKHLEIYSSFQDMEYFEITQWATTEFDGKEYVLIHVKEKILEEDDNPRAVKAIYPDGYTPEVEPEFSFDQVRRQGCYGSCHLEFENLITFGISAGDY